MLHNNLLLCFHSCNFTYNTGSFFIRQFLRRLSRAFVQWRIPFFKRLFEFVKVWKLMNRLKRRCLHKLVHLLAVIVGSCSLISCTCLLLQSSHFDLSLKFYELFLKPWVWEDHISFLPGVCKSVKKWKFMLLHQVGYDHRSTARDTCITKIINKVIKGTNGRGLSLLII